MHPQPQRCQIECCSCVHAASASQFTSVGLPVQRCTEHLCIPLRVVCPVWTRSHYVIYNIFILLGEGGWHINDLNRPCSCFFFWRRGRIAYCVHLERGWYVCQPLPPPPPSTWNQSPAPAAAIVDGRGREGSRPEALPGAGPEDLWGEGSITGGLFSVVNLHMAPPTAPKGGKGREGREGELGRLTGATEDRC